MLLNFSVLQCTRTLALVNCLEGTRNRFFEVKWFYSFLIGLRFTFLGLGFLCPFFEVFMASLSRFLVVGIVVIWLFIGSTHSCACKDSVCQIPFLFD